MQSITLEVVFPSLTSLLFREGYTSMKGEEITFLIGVLCMRRKRMKAFIKSYMKKEKKKKG
jgi:hypothetical protein